MRFPRAAGLLLHPTSLPGPYGIGDVGPGARRFVDWLADSGQTLWQVLPLGPTGFGDSPYACFSAFAGNPWLVSPELLLEERLVEPRDLEGAALPGEGAVDFGAVVEAKTRLLRRAYERFVAGAAPELREPYRAFGAAEAAWLDDFALFMALKQEHAGRPWTEWDAPLARREAAALESARVRLAHAVGQQRFRQFLFFRQWNAVRAHARSRGVRIMGDLPIFVAHDSADAWSRPELFQLDAAGRPTVVAGVPPDYFSPTGQLWGNPLYDWDSLRRGGFTWWIERVRVALRTYDLVRLDHFRGFEAHWEVAADAPTAEGGRWVSGPGADLFAALDRAFGDLPLVAEDLGVITPGVEALREAFGLPGMRILQFAWGDGPSHAYLPHAHVPNCVVYTGTHDNDTLRGWWDHAASGEEKHFARRYLQCDDGAIVRAMVRAAYASVAHTAIVPLQDVLELGSEARMNLPGRPSGNWSWRFRWDALGGRGDWLRDLSEIYGRGMAMAD